MCMGTNLLLNDGGQPVRGNLRSWNMGSVMCSTSSLFLICGNPAASGEGSDEPGSAGRGGSDGGLPDLLRLIANALGSAPEDAGQAINFANKAAARQAFEGDMRVAANRFFRDATSKSQDFQTQALGNGEYRMQFFSPARNPGYGKLYVQEIDSSGSVLREYKDTIGPEGLIERKWVSGGP